MMIKAPPPPSQFSLVFSCHITGANKGSSCFPDIKKQLLATVGFSQEREFIKRFSVTVLEVFKLTSESSLSFDLVTDYKHLRLTLNNKLSSDQRRHLKTLNKNKLPTITHAASKINQCI